MKRRRIASPADNSVSSIDYICCVWTLGKKSYQRNARFLDAAPVKTNSWRTNWLVCSNEQVFSPNCIYGNGYTSTETTLCFLSRTQNSFWKGVGDCYDHLFHSSPQLKMVAASSKTTFSGLCLSYSFWWTAMVLRHGLIGVFFDVLI